MDKLKVFLSLRNRAELRSYRDILVSRNCEVTSSHQGGNVARLLRDGEYDLVFIDHQLSGVDAVRLYNDVKERLPWAEVVLLTYVNDPERISELRSEGIETFLVKPVTPGRFVQFVEDTKVKAKLRRQTSSVAEHLALEEESGGAGGARPGSPAGVAGGTVAARGSGELELQLERLALENAGLKAKVESLEAELAGTRSSGAGLQRLEAERDMLAAESEELRETVDELRRRIRCLEDELEAAAEEREKSASLEDEKRLLSIRIGELEGELERERSVSFRLREELGVLRKALEKPSDGGGEFDEDYWRRRVERLEKEKEEFRKRAVASQEAVERLEKQVVELERRLSECSDASMKRVREMEKLLERAAERIERGRAKRRALAEELKAMAARLAAAEARCEEILEGMRSLEAGKAELEAELEQMQMRAHIAEESAADLSQRARLAEEREAKALKEVGRLQERLERLEREKEELAAEFERREPAMKEMQRRVERAMSRMQEEKRKREDAETRIVELRQRLADAISELEELRLERERLQHSCSERAAALERMRIEYEHLKEEAAKAREISEEVLDERIERLEELLAAKDELLDQLSAELEARTAELERARQAWSGERSRLEEELLQLKESLEKRDAVMRSRMSGELDELRRKEAELEAALEKARAEGGDVAELEAALESTRHAVRRKELESEYQGEWMELGEALVLLDEELNRKEEEIAALRDELERRQSEFDETIRKYWARCEELEGRLERMEGRSDVGGGGSSSARKKVHAVLEGVEPAVLVIDKDMVVQDYNGEFIRMLGLDEGRKPGSTVLSEYPGHHQLYPVVRMLLDEDADEVERGLVVKDLQSGTPSFYWSVARREKRDDGGECYRFEFYPLPADDELIAGLGLKELLADYVCLEETMNRVLAMKESLFSVRIVIEILQKKLSSDEKYASMLKDALNELNGLIGLLHSVH